MSVATLIRYFLVMSVPFHDINSLIGFFLLIVIFVQVISGVMLSFSLLPEPSLIPMVRDEEDCEDLFIDDFFWMHERGVDLIFIFSYFHLFRKLYLNVTEVENESAWKSGVFLFLILQVVVFFGLVLCCTHLSEITLTIAANVLHTCFLFYGKFYWWIFTDKQLNTDTLIRLAYAHYLSAFYFTFIAIIHGLDVHHDWKNEQSFEGNLPEMLWNDEALSNELSSVMDALFIVTIVFWMLYTDPEALSYEIFMWGDIALVTDIRFYGVAPHWYFRPFMGWLIVCPYHKMGLFGLGYFFFVLFHQPSLYSTSDAVQLTKKSRLINVFLDRHDESTPEFKSKSIEYNLGYQTTFFCFMMACFYTSSFLPYGKFYNRLGGNSGMLLAYFYVFLYLTFPFYRNLSFISKFLHFYIKNLKVNFLSFSKHVDTLTRVVAKGKKRSLSRRAEKKA